MILKITEAEARFLMGKLKRSDEDEEQETEVVESISSKLLVAMKKSDNAIDRQLTRTIATLVEAGFDADQVAALSSVRNKAREHQGKKYEGDSKSKVEQL